MYLKRSGQTRSKKDSVYWELVESYRAGREPRQRVVAYLGDIEKAACVGVKQVATERVGSWQSQLFDEDVEPQWVEVDAKRIRVERVRDFGGNWLGLEMLERLNLVGFLDRFIPRGREDVPWSTMSLALVLMRLYEPPVARCGGEPSSELRVAEHLYERSPLAISLAYHQIG